MVCSLTMVYTFNTTNHYFLLTKKIMMIWDEQEAV